MYKQSVYGTDKESVAEINAENYEKRGIRMEDRYLYRAKRLDSEEWVKEKWVKGFYGWLITEKGKKHLIHTGVLDITGLYPTEIKYEIDPSTLCQCTGLKDKNGKLIFEGDIILAGYYKWKCKVVWDKKCARFIGLTNDKDVKIVYVDMVDKHNMSAVEVISNIFDNLELLEV